MPKQSGNSTPGSAFERRIKNHVIGREHDFFAVVQPGFEHVTRSELSGMGINVKNIFIEGGVEFTGKLDSCYTASLMSRTAGRILMRLADFRSVNYFELERLIRSFPWELYLSPDSEIKFRTSASKSMIYHTGKLEEIFTAGINERLGNIGIGNGRDEKTDTQTVFLRNNRDMCTVSLDASGEFLYKRGKGKHIGSAPLRETTAALILLEAGIDNYSCILDSMCGSGTFSIEAVSMLSKTPPAYEREFPFMHWPCFRENAFMYIKNTLMKSVIPRENIAQRIITSDIDEEAVMIAGANIPECFSKIIQPEVRDFFSLKGAEYDNKKTLLVLNPPYGKRIEEKQGDSIYREIGVKVRNDFSNCGYAIIVPGHEKENHLGLKYDRKIPFMNGGLKVSVIFKDV